MKYCMAYELLEIACGLIGRSLLNQTGTNPQIISLLGRKLKNLAQSLLELGRLALTQFSQFFSIKERNENWIKGPEWVDKKPKSWLDIYALLSLWSVDESILYLNSNDFFKANVWQERATILNVFFAYEAPGSFVRNGGKGGKKKSAGYDPLKERVKEFAEQLKTTGRWKSIRNTAMTIAPEIVESSNKLGRNMSPQQAPLTIINWLNEMGFNKKV